jgi:predicted double-glycine peptidase
MVAVDCSKIFLLPIVTLFCSIFCSGCVSEIPLISNAGYAIDDSSSRVSSWKELNEQNVVMQRFDYSCGAASLATMMKYYFDDDVTETKILDYIKTIFSESEYARIEEDGLSFLELEKISRSMGYQTASVRLQLPALRQLSGPVIVFLSTKHYRHFAVLRGVKEDRVFLADPSRGNIHLSISRFMSEWKGETFVLGKKGFGLPDKHNLAILHSPGFRHELLMLRQPLLERPEIAPLKIR